MRKTTLVLSAIILLQVGCTKAYIDDSPIFVESSGNDGSGSEVEHPKYNSDIQSLINNRCTSCHGGAAPSAGLSLNTYVSVRNAAEFGTLIARINSSLDPMPANGLLSLADRATMDNWVADGFPEN